MPGPPLADRAGGTFVFPSFVSGESTTESHYWEHSSQVDRGYDAYSEEFGIDLEQFRGLRILDLGAGVTGKFAREAQPKGLDVTSANPNWRSEAFIDRMIRDPKSPHFVPEWRKDGITLDLAIQEAGWTSFKGGFDVILSLYAVPLYLMGTEATYRKAFGNIQTILADRGVAILNPVGRGVHRNPLFHRLLGEITPGYELLGPEMAPQLLITKAMAAEDEARIESLREGLRAVV